MINSIEDWEQRAACKGQPTYLWYFSKQGTKTFAETRKAKSFCKNCEVKEECLNFAVESEEPFGIWGGKTPDERNVIIRMNLRNRR